MASLTPLSTFRRVIAEAITGNTASGWVESPWPWPLFPGPEPAQILARGFAVGFVGSRTGEDRQKTSGDGSGAKMETTVSVRFSTVIPNDDPLAGYVAALDSEQEIVAAIMADRDGVAPGLRLSEITERAIVADGTVFLGEIRFILYHRYPLEAA